jgi:hypothetical protein
VIAPERSHADHGYINNIAGAQRHSRAAGCRLPIVSTNTANAYPAFYGRLILTNGSS